MGRQGFSMIDLHIHTTHSSDGQYTPGEILNSASQCGVDTLAFCDHMEVAANFEGLDLAAHAGIEYFTGVELSTAWEGREHHLLCYGFEPEGHVLRRLISDACSRIWGRMDEVLEHFRGLGFRLERGEIRGWGSSVPTGVTMLRALVAGNPDDPRLLRYTRGDRSNSPYLNFYRDYALEGFGRSVLSELPDLLETIGVLKDVGVLVLAHPGNVRGDFLKKLKSHGLRGVEVYSSYHGPETISYLQNLASTLGLLSSAGSDFHGEKIKPGISLGDVQGPPDEALMGAVRNNMSFWK
jgi:3',5'-nucleoside bisphosphate phosphatase